mmetsp:Transcript_82073/g.180383  ORF Transcript_82073/g.180383 Transcript_82073/m.180383 type:complete len:225 (+) Transcript_82073:90-764(+)
MKRAADTFMLTNLTFTCLPALVGDPRPSSLLVLCCCCSFQLGLVVLSHQVHQERGAVQDHAVGRPREERGNLLSHRDLAELDETRVLLDGSTDHLRRGHLSLGVDDGLLLLLLSGEHEVAGSLGLLLRNLLRFDGLLVFGGEAEMGDGNVVEQDVEVLRALREVVADRAADKFTLHDELRGVVLCHHALQDFVNDGGKDLLVVVQAERPVDSRKVACIGLAECS